MKTEKCPFCNLSSDVEIIYESELVIAFYDKFPVNVGHALIIPKRHVANYFDLTAEEISEMQGENLELYEKLQQIKNIMSE
jgi:diadenosine tetraphosphate (Ap4A) HIT family hydrolase